MGNFRHNIHQLLVSLDQTVNMFICLFTGQEGWADESYSSRAWRKHLAGNDRSRKIVDHIFFWQKQHCEDAYNGEREGRQEPPELR